jgi:hypothetical protein
MTGNMRDEEKPFICYKTGRWSFKIEPRNAEGWRATALWLAGLIPIGGSSMWITANRPTGILLWLYIGLFTVAMLLWAVGMIRWMKARSEIVDIDELLQIKRERDAEQRRKGR